jgi:lipopolysaccharide transport system ATP-binding protein
VSISVDKVCKIYRIWRHPSYRWKAALQRLADHVRPAAGRRAWRQRYGWDFRALEDISFRVQKGEAVAILGRNGSGKSTLLQIVAGTMQASSGTVATTGQVAALLELGAGFDPDFSGRDNVYLNGAILGLAEAEIDRRYEEILAFADIGAFIEQPVKTYSSGMRMRLAFAVLSAIEPEILIIDEALSVGDAFFQSKCVRWLESYVTRGGTLLCVSHDVFMVQRLCQRGIVLEKGRMVTDNTVAEAVTEYYRLQRDAGYVGERRQEIDEPAPVAAPVGIADADGWFPLPLRIKERTGDGRIRIEQVRTQPELAGGLQVSDWLRIQVVARATRAIEDFHFGFGFRDRSGQLVGGFHTFYDRVQAPSARAGDHIRVECEVQVRLRPQVYLLLIGFALNHTVEQWQDLDCLWDCARVQIRGEDPFWGVAPMPVRGVQVEIMTDD